MEDMPLFAMTKPLLLEGVTHHRPVRRRRQPAHFEVWLSIDNLTNPMVKMVKRAILE